MKNPKLAILLGANGVIGSYCLKELLIDKYYNEVITFTRKPIENKITKHRNYVIDFNHLEKYKTLITANDIFCCLGTTIGKAGSKEAFKKVDYEYSKQFAEYAKENNAEQFILISSLGADANSGNFYLKTKGEIEQALITLSFKSLIIFRPSILLGPRQEVRVGELMGKFVMQTFGFLFIGPLKKYKGIHAQKVAKAMVHYAKEGRVGVNIIESDILNQLR